MVTAVGHSVKWPQGFKEVLRQGYWARQGRSDTRELCRVMSGATH